MKDINEFNPMRLSHVRTLQNEDYIGDGEILKVTTSPQEVMYIETFKTIFAAMRGRKHGGNKLRSNIAF